MGESIWIQVETGEEVSQLAMPISGGPYLELRTAFDYWFDSSGNRWAVSSGQNDTQVWKLVERLCPVEFIRRAGVMVRALKRIGGDIATDALQGRES